MIHYLKNDIDRSMCKNRSNSPSIILKFFSQIIFKFAKWTLEISYKCVCDKSRSITFKFFEKSHFINVIFYRCEFMI